MVSEPGVFPSARFLIFHFNLLFSWLTHALPCLVNLTIDAGSQIAAMSYLLDDLRYVQVLVTHEDGGVMMAYLDGGPDKHWAETTSVSGMEDIIPLSPIAANQAGRVYALENVNGTPEIVEWKRNSTTGTPTFERLGPVTPTPTT